VVACFSASSGVEYVIIVFLSPWSQPAVCFGTIAMSMSPFYFVRVSRARYDERMEYLRTLSVKNGRSLSLSLSVPPPFDVLGQFVLRSSCFVLRIPYRTSYSCQRGAVRPPRVMQTSASASRTAISQRY
jgi:hypothetical protein